MRSATRRTWGHASPARGGMRSGVLWLTAFGGGLRVRRLPFTSFPPGRSGLNGGGSAP